MCQAADLISWARTHDWGEYLSERDGEDPPYGEDSSVDNVGKGHDLVVLPGGVSAHGVVFSSERMIVANLLTALEDPQGIAGKSDGTHKISYEGGWELFSIGTHAVAPLLIPLLTADC